MNHKCNKDMNFESTETRAIEAEVFRLTEACSHENTLYNYKSLHRPSPTKQDNRLGDNSLDITFEHLNQSLGKIREDGFNKLSTLARHLKQEKHCYMQNVEVVGKTIDEQVSKIKSDVDLIHLEMKEKLKDMNKKMDRKFRNEMESYKRQIKDMNKLIQEGFDILQQEEDNDLLFHYDSKLQEQIKYVETLHREIQKPPPIFRRGLFTKDIISGLIGKIERKKPEDFLNESGSKNISTQSGKQKMVSFPPSQNTVTVTQTMKEKE